MRQEEVVEFILQRSARVLPQLKILCCVVGINRTLFVMEVPVNWQAFFFFPAANSAHTPLQVSSDLFPGFQSFTDRESRRLVRCSDFPSHDKHLSWRD